MKLSPAVGIIAMLAVCMTALTTGAEEPRPDVDVWTRERIAATVPTWPNPFLAFLPCGATPDMAYWRARLHMEAIDRRASSPAKKRATIAEAETPGVIGGNDHPLVGEWISGFGSFPWTVEEVTISGFLRDAPADGGSAPEPDDAIPFATVLNLPPGSRVSVAGVVGDGFHGGGGSAPSGDFDFFSVNASAGDTIEVIVMGQGTPPDLNPIVAVYDSTGSLIAFNDNVSLSGILTNRDSWLVAEAPANGTYLIAVAGWAPSVNPLLSDPFDPSSGPGVGSEGAYHLVVGLDAPDPGDVDCFRFSVRAGDVLGATVLGATRISLESLDREVLVDTDGGDLSAVYPAVSTLPGGGNATIARTVDSDGELAVCVLSPVFYEVGDFRLDLRVDRSPLDLESEPLRQILFVDFDGAEVDQGWFGLPPAAVHLSPLAAFLSGWGLEPSDEDALIDGILDVVRENLERDVRERGGNGDAASTGLPAQFDIEIRSSRDDPDPLLNPLVARVVVGGSISELGLPTVGIAEHIDPGNLETAGTAVVLLDLLSSPAPDPTSLNTVERAPGVSLAEVVALAVGNIVSHEAGHLFGNFHTARDVGSPTIMDLGGDILNILGASEDSVVGSADDLDVDLGPDNYSPRELFSGIENTLEVVSFGLPLGGVGARVVALPPALVLGPTAVGSAVSETVRLGNVGTAQISVDGAVVIGVNADRFTVASAGLPASMPAGGSHEIGVSFVIDQISVANAVLEVSLENPAAPVVEVELEGRAGVPTASIAPVSLHFGTLQYGDSTTSIVMQTVVSNQGVGPLSVDHTVMSGGTPQRFEIDAGGAPFVLAPATSRVLDVAFRPKGEVGSSHTTLVLVTDDPTAPRIDAALRGFADGPDIVVSPPSPYHFGSVTLGESRTRRFRIFNTGFRTLHISGSTVTGDPGGGFFITAGDGPVDLDPGEEWSVSVRATPVEEGSFEGELLISSDDPDEGELVVRLEIESQVPVISLTPSAFEYGPVRIGTVSSKRFWMVNEGDGRLVAEAPFIVGADSRVFVITAGAVPVQLFPGSVWPIDVEYQPDSVSDHGATLVIESNDPLQPRLEASLAGSGGLPELVLDKRCQGGFQPLCTLTVSNLGPVTAAGVQVKDSLPADLVWAGDDCGAGMPVGGVWTWTIPQLDPGASLECAVLLEVLEPQQEPIVNVATVQWAGTPPGEVDDQASASITAAMQIAVLGQSGLLLLIFLIAVSACWLLRRV